MIRSTLLAASGEAAVAVSEDRGLCLNPTQPGKRCAGAADEQRRSMTSLTHLPNTQKGAGHRNVKF